MRVEKPRSAFLRSRQPPVFFFLNRKFSSSRKFEIKKEGINDRGERKLGTAIRVVNYAGTISHDGHGYFSKLRAANAGRIGKAGICKEYFSKSRGREVGRQN